jgi:hypothetical protein
VQGNAAFQGFPQDLFLFLQALAAGFYVHLANDGIFFGGGVWLPPAPVPRYNITPAGRHCMCRSKHAVICRCSALERKSHHSERFV